MKNTSALLAHSLAVIALLPTLLASPAPAQTSPAALFKDAHAAMSGGDYRSAYEKYRKLVENGRPPEGSGVDFVVVANDLGVISAMSNDLANALVYLNLALRVAEVENPQSSRTFDVLKNLSLAVGRSEGPERAAEYRKRMAEIRRTWYKRGDGGAVENVEQRLMWTGTDSGEEMVGGNASAYCAGVKQGGFDDWRVPTLQEVIGIHDSDTSAPVGGITIGSCCVWAQTTVKSPVSDDMVTGLLKFNFSGSTSVEDPENLKAGVLCVRDTSSGGLAGFPLAALPERDTWWEKLPAPPGGGG